MTHAVTADRHTGGNQLAHARAVQVARFAEQTGDEEEARGQVAVDECGQRHIDVRRVPIIE
jgi:hypothetical protein